MKAISAAHLFELPDGITYLNCANMSPQLKTVTAAGLDAVRIKTSPWTLNSENWFSSAEELRAVAAKVIGTGVDSVALIPAVSYGMATAAANLPIQPGASILLLAQDFPSNVYTWREAAKRKDALLITVERDPGTGWTEAVLGAIDERTAIVCVPPCHWMDGSIVDLVRIAERARQVGSALVVDASQALGAMPLDIGGIQPDFLVSVGYKWLLGPYGLGYLYAAPRWQNSGTPIEQSWMPRRGSNDFTRVAEYCDEFQPGARRYDVGEFTQFVMAPMATVALQQILDWGIPAIEQSIGLLTDVIAQRALELGYSVQPSGQRARHMLGIRFPGGLPATLPAALSDANVYASIRGDSLRIAPYLYNDASDIDRLFAAVAAAV